MEGWVKIHRKMLKWQWADSPQTFSLFVHLLLMANNEKCKWHDIEIERGQLVTSVEDLSNVNGLSKQQVRTGLARLVASDTISIKSTNKYTIITICNYAYYQDVKQTSNKQITNKQQTNNKQITNKQQTNNKQITNKQQTNNKQITNKQQTNNNKQEYKEVKNINNKERNIKKESLEIELSEEQPYGEFTEVVNQWLAYKKSRRQTYKNQQTINVMVNKLRELSNNDVATAKAIVEQSIANNYSGLFALKGTNKPMLAEDKTDHNKRVYEEAISLLQGKELAPISKQPIIIQ